MSEWRAGDKVRYWHAMLDRSFDAAIIRTTARGIVFRFTDKDWPIELPGKRSLTHSQADERLTRVW